MHGFGSALVAEMQDKDFRDAYVSEHARRGLATQIRSLRETRGWSQAELGRRTEKPQSNVSRWEDFEYGKFNLQTLIDVAAAFDVALLVRFVPFGEFVARTDNVSDKAFQVLSFDEERAAEKASAEHEAMQRLLSQSGRPQRAEAGGGGKKVVAVLQDEPPRPTEHQRAEDNALLGRGLRHLIESAQKEHSPPPPGLGTIEGAREAWIS